MEGVLAYTTLFAGNFAPKNWSFCQGQILPISSNTALFSLLGTTYGGNGSTTFALPDLRGRAVVGAGQGPGLSPYTLGETGGTETTPLSYNEMATHAHPTQVTIIPAGANNVTVPNPVNGVWGQGTENLFFASGDSQMQGYIGTLAMQNSGGGVPFPNLHPVLALNYIICFAGLFPSRN